jgi:hypothetical protein
MAEAAQYRRLYCYLPDFLTRCVKNCRGLRPNDGFPRRYRTADQGSGHHPRLDISDRPREAMAGIVAVGFSQADKDRMNALAAKAREGRLTPDERAEAEASSRIGSLLGILKSKARQSLRSYSSM